MRRLRALCKKVPALLTLTVLVATLLSGCYRTHLVFDGGMPRDIDRPRQAKVANLHRTFVFGLWELDGSIPIDGVCPSGVAYIYQRLGGWSWVISVLSSGLVAGRDMTVVCCDGSRVELKVE
ncbi:MAG: hypothetical protein CSA65_03630 [Proteobacteria bacterium]|nr:MAG: hypothetical protein CSA65_03630 [Pseudomonadota bacterium]